MNNRKKRIGFVTSSAAGPKTGFSTHSRNLLSYLYSLDKYEIFHLVQAFHEKDPTLKMQPWHSQGAITEAITQTEQFHKDDSFRRLVSYGNMTVKDWVIKNELDFVVHVEDIWSSHLDAYVKQDWFQFVKNNFIQHTTLDSLPILPDAITWAENTKYFWCWSDFAEKELKRIDSEKFNHVKTVYGTLNCDNFKPISQEEKNNLRKRFNLSEDDVIISFLSRNQLRKLFFANLEGLAKYKKQFPEGKKVKLLFHTGWSEPGGWPIDRIRTELGLDREDVLATYYCSKCNNWAIMPFNGENLKCPFCGENNTFSTAGISSPITEKELSYIYGICDANCHLMTSGGLEYAMVEGLLCGLPLATISYSCGETFTQNSFVESIDHTLTREVGTAFYKAVPNPNSIAKFYKKISDIVGTKKYKEISQAGRLWAIKNFHVENIAAKFQEVFDNSEYLDWNKYHEFKKDYDVKSPEAEIPEVESDAEFIKVLYKNILKMDVDENDSGFQSWFSNFKNLPEGTSAEQRQGVKKHIEASFRKIAFDLNQKNSGVTFESLIDKEKPNKRLLFAIKESGGDCYIATSLFEDIKNQYGEDTDIYVMTDNKYFEIFQGNPFVYKLLPWFEPFSNENIAIGSGKPIEEKPFHYFMLPTVATQYKLNYLSHSLSRTF